MPRARATSVLMILLVGWLVGLPADAAETLRIDFEQGAEPGQYKRLDLKSYEAAVVPREGDTKGHCLRIHNTTPATACGVQLKGPVTLEKNLMLSFDYRTEIEPGFEGTYLGMIFYVEGKQWFWHSDAFTSEWRHAEVPLGSLRPWHEHTVQPGLVFSGIQLYGRVKDQTPVKGETKARMTVYLDNIQIAVSQRQSVLTDRVRQSTANPPLFHWPPPEAGCLQRLQYSRDPEFAKETTVTVDAKWNFYTPAEPLEPGCWYWRVWTNGELFEGWSDIERVEVLPDAHRFTTPAMPLESLASRPRPRLLPVARLTEPNLTDARKKQLVKNAEKLFKQGVPEHPGPHVPGDPRWPTWIDWYGKVAGGITGGTGATTGADRPLRHVDGRSASDRLGQAIGAGGLSLGPRGRQRHAVRGHRSASSASRPELVLRRLPRYDVAGRAPTVAGGDRTTCRTVLRPAESLPRR